MAAVRSFAVGHFPPSPAIGGVTLARPLSIDSLFLGPGSAAAFRARLRLGGAGLAERCHQQPGADRKSHPSSLSVLRMRNCHSERVKRRGEEESAYKWDPSREAHADVRVGSNITTGAPLSRCPLIKGRAGGNRENRTSAHDTCARKPHRIALVAPDSPPSRSPLI